MSVLRRASPPRWKGSRSPERRCECRSLVCRIVRSSAHATVDTEIESANIARTQPKTPLNLSRLMRNPLARAGYTSGFFDRQEIVERESARPGSLRLNRGHLKIFRVPENSARGIPDALLIWLEDSNAREV